MTDLAAVLLTTGAACGFPWQAKTSMIVLEDVEVMSISKKICDGSRSVSLHSTQRDP